MSYTWIKAGKKVYEWGNYNKKAVNGTLRLREMMSQYIQGWDFATEAYPTISSLKSSNPSIIKPAFKSKYGYIKYTSKKFGTATVTYTMSYTDENGHPPATKPVHLNYWACALEPGSHSY